MENQKSCGPNCCKNKRVQILTHITICKYCKTVTNNLPTIDKMYCPICKSESIIMTRAKYDDIKESFK